MKTLIAAATFAALALTAPAQDNSAQKSFQQRVQEIVMPAAIDPLTGLPIPQPELPKFNLDFPGGTPDTFVEYINEEIKTKAPLNAIVPHEYREIMVPAMKLKSVNVEQVFEALGKATAKTEQWVGQNNVIQQFNSSFTFETKQPVTTNSIWYLVVKRPDPSPDPRDKVLSVRYYQLAPYLEQGLDVNDITTAIKAGYKMLGETNPPELNFHKETQLLIAVAPYSKLTMIEEVLRNLPKAPSRTRMPGGALPGIPAPQSLPPSVAPN